MSVNYDRVCRLCLTSRAELLPIFPTTSSNDTEPASVLASKIKDCVSVQISENDALPTNVCRKCVNNVNNWHTFKSVCERAQNKLQSLFNKDGSLLEEFKIKNEPLSDSAYDDGVVIDGSYPDLELPGPSNKLQPEGPPILASLGLTPRSDKGLESEKEEEDGNDNEIDTGKPLANIPEVSVTVMRPTGETLQAQQGIQKLASKECLVCGRAYRYSHNARRHELGSHGFDRYTNKIMTKRPNILMQTKLRPNPFNPKARLMPNPISHKMKLLPKHGPSKMISHKVIPPKPIPIRTTRHQNNLPYPLRIKALKDLQIKKKEPQILKTLLTSKPEVLISEPEIINSGPASPETLISEPEIASFQVEAILTEPEIFSQEDEGADGEEITGDTQNHHYDTVDMESDNEIEIAREKENANEEQHEENRECSENVDYDGGLENVDHDDSHVDYNNSDNDHDDNVLKNSNEGVHQQNDGDSHEEEALDDDGTRVNEQGDQVNGSNEDLEDDYHQDENQDMSQDENHDENLDVKADENQDENEEEEDEDASNLAPVVEINEDMQTNSYNSEQNDEEEELDDPTDPSYNAAEEQKAHLDPDKVYVTKTQKDFIETYRNIIEQINTKRCLCCDREHPRRKAVIQHLQKNGHIVPKHTCYNCVVTFGHIGALLSHMRANVCTDLWKIIYNENGITDDMVVEDEEVKESKTVSKDILSARSYACKLCPAKFRLKQYIMRHVLDAHEGGQSMVPLTCVHCRTRFKDRSYLKKHVRNGQCTVNISCDLCSERFDTVHVFNDHVVSVHTGELDETSQSKLVEFRSTDCTLCGKKLTNVAMLAKHLKLIHNEEKPYFCRHCDSKFEQSTDLNDHIYMEHSGISTMKQEPDMSIVKEETEEYHYSCTECNAIFETVDAWTDHQVAEHNQVAHQCDQCEKKFLRPSELAEHKNTHLRVKFYPCSVCPNSYSTPQKLSDHVQQVHPGAATTYPAVDAEFYCDICIRCFKSRQAYSNHMRIHAKVPTTNRKPGESKGFAPQIIGKPIKQFPVTQPQNNVSLGQKWNVPNAPYSCDICGKGFMHKKNIWKHKKVLHADLLGDRNDSEENTMHASTEEDEYNDSATALSTPRFNSFNFTNFSNSPQQQQQDTMAFSCEICYKRFPLKTSLWKHKRAKHGIMNSTSGEGQTLPSDNGSRSSCTICRINFSDKKSYYRHRKNVHKSATQMCKICGKPLNSTLELYEHLKAAHARELLGYNANQGSSKSQETSQELEQEYEGEQELMDPSADYQARYPCDTCGKHFVGLLALQNHQCVNQSTSQPQSFNCEICHKSYSSIAALKSHRGWHLRSPDGKAAANNSGLWMPQHKVTSKVSKHEILDPVQLAKVVQQSAPAAAVMKRRLPPEVEVTVVNPNKKLRSDDSVDVDYQNNTSSGVEDRYCQICDKEFTKRAAYQRHMDEVHQPNSVFCPVCDKSFTRKSTLLVHMKKHYEGGEGTSAGGSQMEEEEEEEVFTCDVCDAQYSSEKALRTHRARHHGDESADSDDGATLTAAPGEFTCAQCGDGVATPRDLIAHRNMHATPTKFFCNICKVYFARAIDLSTHTRARHADNEKVFFPCAMCDRFYTNKKSLQRHIEISH